MWIMPRQVAASNVEKVNKLALQCDSGKQKACNELTKIAMRDKDFGVRYSAVMKLTDQSVLAKIAVGDEAGSVRGAAVMRLTDQPLLAKVAMEDKENRVRNIALAKLTDQPLLAKIVLEAANGRVVNDVMAKLTDQSLLAKIAVEHRDFNIRYLAVTKLADRSLLAKIAVEDKDATVRSTAVAKLVDQSVLAKIAVEDKESSVRGAAMAKLTDQSLLEKIALEATDAGARSAAVAKLADKVLLAKIAVEDKDASVRRLAGTSAQQVQKRIGEGQDIMDLLEEKEIEIRAQGNGIQGVSVSIRKLVPNSVIVRIPVGSFFVSSNPSAQNMVTTGERKVQLTTDEWVSASLGAACANRPKHIPSGRDTFTVQRSPNQAELAKLMPVVDKAEVDTKTSQAAVWIVTDNASYSDLGILVSSFSGFSGSRVINEEETARAMKICDEAGIDITKKAIWNDRQQIVSRLKNGDLKAWLANR